MARSRSRPAGSTVDVNGQLVPLPCATGGRTKRTDALPGGRAPDENGAGHVSGPIARPPASAAATNGGAVRPLIGPVFHASFQALAESVGGARRAVLGWLETCGDDDWRRDDIALAVSEACTNVVYHAYPAPRTGLFDITAEVVQHELRVSVRDTGVGMRPRTDSPGSGMGLGLIARCSKSVTVDATSHGTDMRITFSPA